MGVWDKGRSGGGEEGKRGGDEEWRRGGVEERKIRLAVKQGSGGV